MDEFMLPVEFEGTVREFATRIVRKGYTYRFEVNIDNTVIYFEEDEEGSNYLAMGTSDLSMNQELLLAIAISLKAIAS